MVENEMKALRISDAIGAEASRMRVIFMAEASLGCHAQGVRHHRQPLADQINMPTQVVELI